MAAIISPELTEKLLDSFKQKQSLADKAAEEGAAWLDAYIARKGIDKDKLTKVDWFHLTRMIPCSIRCWRIGEPVTTKPGEPCPECGQMVPLPTVWEKILGDDT